MKRSFVIISSQPTLDAGEKIRRELLHRLALGIIQRAA